MRKIIAVVSCIVACVSLLAASGCLPAVAAGGTAGIREITDKVVTYKGNAEAVENAVRKAMKDTGAIVKEVVREEGKAAKRTIRGRTFDDEHLTIDIEPVTPSTCEVEVRVGRIGSKSRAEDFHKSLAKYLSVN